MDISQRVVWSTFLKKRCVFNANFNMIADCQPNQLWLWKSSPHSCSYQRGSDADDIIDLICLHGHMHCLLGQYHQHPPLRCSLLVGRMPQPQLIGQAACCHVTVFHGFWSNFTLSLYLSNILQLPQVWRLHVNFCYKMFNRILIRGSWKANFKIVQSFVLRCCSCVIWAIILLKDPWTMG